MARTAKAYNSKTSLEDLQKLVIARGYSQGDIGDFSRAQLIEVLEQTEAADTVSAAEAGERIESLDGFKGNTVHVHEMVGDTESKYVRSYSEEEHGEDFLALAASFKSKHPKRFFVK